MDRDLHSKEGFMMKGSFPDIQKSSQVRSGRDFVNPEGNGIEQVLGSQNGDHC